MKRSIALITILILLIGAVFFISFSLQKKSTKEFLYEGYIINNSMQSENNISTTKYYFDAETPYKQNYENKIIFKNTEKEEIKVADDSFIHYTNGSISVLKKTAILNMSDLSKDASLIKYYNLFANSILMKNGTQYSITNQKNVLNFSNFIIKSSENKYLIAGNQMKLYVGKTEKELTNTYLELEIFDGNIIRLANQEVTYQNISDSFYLVINGDTRIDFSNRNIYKNDEFVLSLESITINKDDNIEIIEDKKEETDEDPKDDENNEPTKPEIPEDPTGGIQDGNIDSGGNNNEEEVNEFEKLSDPIFQITSQTVTSNKFHANIEITDEDSILNDDIKIKIIDAASNKIVYQDRKLDGSHSFDITVENLSPDVSYIFIVSATYQKNGSTFERDFIQRSFVTNSVGVVLEKDYFTMSSLAFKIIKKEYSKVKSLEAVLLDGNGQIIKTTPVELTEESTEILFNELIHNKEYKVVLQNFLYDSAIISNDFNIENTYQTLKERPTFGLTTFTIDKKNALFNMRLNNINDPDNGIITYRYEIYDARDIEEGNPIQIIEKNNKSSADLSIDNIKIIRGVPYAFRVVSIFNDNEKEIEYTTDMSQPMKMDGVEFPAIRFEKKEVTFEKIEGNIIITDNGNTINLEDSSIMTITYTDSVGNTQSFTTSGNLNIPFSVNNLRKNETYTISLYATVNLQDGNQAIDNCYIGSVVIKTEDTNPFTLNYSIDGTDTTTAFNIKARLLPTEGVDTTLEANTLTGLTFNLYQGRGTSGALVKSVKKVDRDLTYYNSELKKEYYDKDFKISPELFGLRNNDLSAEYYTIEVTNAYDYTIYQNDIPVKNNTILVKTNGYVPDIPVDTDNAIDFSVIRNKDAGDQYKDYLKPETVVGYRVKANYDNSKKYAKEIIYSIHKASDKKVISTFKYVVPDTGELEYFEIYLKDGTEFTTIDTDFRRGNEYFISYKALLDLDFNGTAETTYPVDSNIILRSKTLTPEKEVPYFEMYPSTSTSNTFVWKYRFQDVDHALYENKMYYQMGNREIGNLNINVKNEFQSLTFSNLYEGYFNTYVKQALIKRDDQIKNVSQVYQYFDSIYKAPTISYNVSLEKNRVLIQLIDFDSNRTFYNRVSSAKVVFTSNQEEIVLDKQSIDNGNIIVDLSLLEKFLGKEITTNVYLYYDSGVTGFDTPGDYFSLQMVKSALLDGQYYSMDEAGILKTNYDALGSFFNYQFNASTKKLVLNNLIYNTNYTLDVNYDASGVIYRYEYLLMKKNEILNASPNGINKFSFDMIIPGVSLMNAQKELTIVPNLVGASLNIQLYGNAGSQIENDKIFIEVYETDETATSSTLVQTVEVSTHDLANSIVIQNLNTKTNYFLRIFANVFNGQSFVKTQLYDVDYQSDTKQYYFKTLGDVGVTDLNVAYSATDYNKKYLSITYNLKEIVGYDEITYEVYKITYSSDGSEILELIELNTTKDYVFTKNMKKLISIPPGSGVEATNTYLIKVRAFKNVLENGVENKIELTEENSNNAIRYTFEPRIQPSVGITSTRKGDAITFKVSIYDYPKVVVNGKYTIKIFNNQKEDITPSEYVGVEYNITDYNKSFVLKNVLPENQYELVVYYKTNTINGLSTIEDRNKTYTTITVNENEIALGQIDIIPDSIETSKMKLVFYNSNKLTDIKKIRYSIYSNNDYAVDKEIEFTPTYVNEGDQNYYTFVLPDILTSTGRYYLQLQFLTDVGIVAEESLEYNYVK